MSPVFDKSQLCRRWLHLPSLAVIALAGASVAIAHMGVAAWRDRWLPKHEHEQATTQLVGRGEIHHVPPDRIEWSVTVSASAKQEDDARAALAARTQNALDKLLAAGVQREDIRLDEAMLAAPAADDIYGGLIEQQATPARPPHYEATQAITIRTAHVAASLASYQTVALQPTASIDVTPPTCWREDTDALRRQAQELASADLNRQISLLSKSHIALGKPLAVEESDAQVGANGDTNSCDGDQTARATVTVTYELR